ncbi:acetylxylan esterase [Chitinophaga agrisoli]|uniref:Acetylxylan esterase n=1 Tax=Chitinophaga agrisoli TaxID=2607653 RepID=A0A5B2VLR3_9BACT|nr:acetylxylan esterase [Chitinophaga agrisoli]KAA2239845.1 acetylxylan esterase [Chitinophaga agrisoli]
MKRYYIIGCLLTLIQLHTYGQAQTPPAVVAGIPVNYDEQQVGAYSLPDPLTAQDGTKVTDTDAWLHKRRPEIVKMFEALQFGKAPGKPAGMRFEVFDKGTPVFGGAAIRKQVTIYLSKDTLHKMDLLIYLPAKAVKPSPLLLQVSFFPNSLAVEDPGVKPGFMWDKTGHKVPAVKTRPATLPVERFIANGIGIATVYYGDIEPDFKEGIRYGIRGLYLKPGAEQPADDEWGAISAWAWGLSRAMDYLQTDRSVDDRRIAVTGASRLGKTALWTGAHDTRFALVIASISGEGGAALSRRNYGETVKHITDTSRYFYQFAPNYHGYSDKVSSLPMDGHMLISLVAPRPLLLQTGNTDYWSDPKGEFLAAVAAEPVYRLFGKQGPGTDVMPAAGDTSLLHPLGYYMHAGGHAVLPGDYDVFITFIHKYMK